MTPCPARRPGRHRCIVRYNASSAAYTGPWRVELTPRPISGPVGDRSSGGGLVRLEGLRRRRLRGGFHFGGRLRFPGRSLRDRELLVGSGAQAPDDIIADGLLSAFGLNHDQLEFVIVEVDRVSLDLRVTTLLLRDGRGLDLVGTIGRGRLAVMRRRLQNAFVP